MRNKNVLRIVFLFIVTALAVSVCAPAAPPAPTTAPPTASSATQATKAPAASGPIKIGVVYPLSGSLAGPGADSQAAVDLAVEIINNTYDLEMPLARTKGLPNLGGGLVEVVYADHAMDPQKAASETERLITERGSVAVLGAWASATTATASQVAERLGVPILAENPTSPGLGERGFKWFFRTTPHDKQFVRDLMMFLRDMRDQKNAKVKNIAILHEDTLFGTDTSDVVKKSAAEFGFEIVADIAYPQNATDATSEVQRIKAARPDVLIDADYTSNAILAVRTFKDLDLNVDAIVANDNGFIDLQYMKAVGKDGNFIFSRDLWSTDWVQQNKMVSAVNDMYKKKTGKELSGTSARAPTGLIVLAEAINRAGSTKPDAIRQALLATNIPANQLIMPWKGVKFDPATGENTLGSGIVVQMLEGSYYTVWPFDRAAKQPVWPMPKWNAR